MSQQPSSPAREDSNSSSPMIPNPDSVPPQPSSPALFYSSSSSQADTYGRNNSQNQSQGDGNIRAAIGSSPLNFPSSSQRQTSDIFLSQRRQGRNGSSANTPGRSRYHSDLRSDRALPSSSSSLGGNSHNRIHMRRNDIHTSDLSSPRRIVDFDTRSGANTMASSSSSAPPSEISDR